MAVVLGINAVFHDPAAAIVVDGRIVAAAEEERFSRIKHGKRAVPFSTWELPEHSIRWCLETAEVKPRQIDAVSYSYDPSLLQTVPLQSPVGCGSAPDLSIDEWEPLRTLYASQAPSFLASAVPGLDGDRLRFVRHHLAHAASSYLASGFADSAVLVIDGRGEVTTHLAGHAVSGGLEVLASQPLPHSLGLMYEALTVHLGFQRSSDEYKVMAMASYGRPKHLDRFRELVGTTADGGFFVQPIDWSEFACPREAEGPWDSSHADLASTVQHRLEEVILELAWWLHERTGSHRLSLAGGVALNCVANSRLLAEGPFDEIFVQPAAGDAGTALGGALYVAHELGDTLEAFNSAALGRQWTDDELETFLKEADLAYERPWDLPAAVAEVICGNGVVAWFNGRSEYGPRALGHRSLLANPTRPENLHRLNTIKGREQFRPVAPMVTLEQASEIFDGPLPSPYMLFTHQVREQWRDRIPAAVHVDGSARVQTVDRNDEPTVHALLEAVEERIGVPVLVNTSLNTAGRPMVDDPRDALECFGSAPVDLLVLGSFLVRRPKHLAS